MTSRSRSSHLDELKAEVAAVRDEALAGAQAGLERGRELSEDAKREIAATVERLGAEKARLQSELGVLEERISELVGKQRQEIEREISAHPLQSVLIAFGVGFIAARILRL